LYIFVDEHSLCARLPAADKCAGNVDEFARIVPAIRTRWPWTRLRICGDSGFYPEEIPA
jgi:hypothetical protein